MESELCQKTKALKYQLEQNLGQIHQFGKLLDRKIQMTFICT